MLPERSCPVAHAATLGECTDGLRCVLVLEIDDACVVKRVNELELPEGTSESDGAGIEDLVWPQKDGPLYLVNRTDPWSWAAVSSPLTAPRDALARATWTPERIGDLEPEGYQYGLATDGNQAFLVGCKKWGDDCGRDAEECEEWFCTQHVFADLKTKKKLAKAPALPYVGGPKTGQVADGVTLGTRGKGKKKELTCASGAAEADTFYGDPIDGSIALSPTDWLALRYANGSRMLASWRVDATYMRGCDDVDVGRVTVIGPTPLWARVGDTGYELQVGPFGGLPLTDASGNVKTFGDTLLTFTVE